VHLPASQSPRLQPLLLGLSWPLPGALLLLPAGALALVADAVCGAPNLSAALLFVTALVLVAALLAAPLPLIVAVCANAGALHNRYANNAE
jgi:hypothetical protein